MALNLIEKHRAFLNDCAFLYWRKEFTGKAHSAVINKMRQAKWKGIKLSPLDIYRAAHYIAHGEMLDFTGEVHV